MEQTQASQELTKEERAVEALQKAIVALGTELAVPKEEWEPEGKAGYLSCCGMSQPGMEEVSRAVREASWRDMKPPERKRWVLAALKEKKRRQVREAQRPEREKAKARKERQKDLALIVDRLAKLDGAITDEEKEPLTPLVKQLARALGIELAEDLKQGKPKADGKPGEMQQLIAAFLVTQQQILADLDKAPKKN
jgi:pyruvate/2-oxoglutarate dehydrogenase complex dihydrolipoamide acyltransferase (E2) component